MKRVPRRSAAAVVADAVVVGTAVDAVAVAAVDEAAVADAAVIVVEIAATAVTAGKQASGTEYAAPLPIRGASLPSKSSKRQLCAQLDSRSLSPSFRWAVQPGCGATTTRWMRCRGDLIL